MANEATEHEARESERQAINARVPETLRLPMSMATTRPRERQAYVTGELAAISLDVKKKLKEALDGTIPFHQDLWELGLRMLQVGSVSQSYGLALTEEKKAKGGGMVGP